MGYANKSANICTYVHSKVDTLLVCNIVYVYSGNGTENILPGRKVFCAHHT